MRRLLLSAFLAVPLLLIATSEQAKANPPDLRGFGCSGLCLGLFPGIHQHGPLFNYGPYYGYYPFKPYGPWDAYLRYDPFFYGDPYRNWKPPGDQVPEQPESGNMYGWNPKLHSHSWRHGIRVGSVNLFHHHGCSSCGFWHASWLHGGWFRGHSWLNGGFGHGHKSGCSSCGGVASVAPVLPTGEVTARYSGFGSPAQSAVFYSASPTLDPMLEVVPTSGQTK